MKRTNTSEDLVQRRFWGFFCWNLHDTFAEQHFVFGGGGTHDPSFSGRGVTSLFPVFVFGTEHSMYHLLILFWSIDWQGGLAPKDLSKLVFYFPKQVLQTAASDISRHYEPQTPSRHPSDTPMGERVISEYHDIYSTVLNLYGRTVELIIIVFRFYSFSQWAHAGQVCGCLRGVWQCLDGVWTCLADVWGFSDIR